MPKPHLVTEDDLTEWLNREGWALFAMSVGSNTHKKFEVSNERIFRITDEGVVKYLGGDPKLAVRAYNEAP